jgi:pilus assembly protein CpaC
MREIFHTALVALALVVPHAAWSADAPEASSSVLKVETKTVSSKRITLGLDKAITVDLDQDARDVLVSNPEIVDAVVRTPRRIFLLAKKTGQTNAFFFDAQGRQFLSVDIRVEKDITDLAAVIHTAMPTSDIKVSALNDNVVLSGTVSSALETQRAQDLAARFAGDATKVVNMISVRGSEQIMLKVRVAEMSRSIAKQFGVDLSTVGKIDGVPVVASTSNPYGLLGRALSDLSSARIGQVCSNGCANHSNAQGVLKALEQVGLVHILAEPNLTAVSGETANSLVGGEFPVPTGRDREGNVTIEFKPFGVKLAFTPVVMSGGRISLQVATEVSELTNTGAFFSQGGTTTDSNGNIITTPGLTIPALAVRRASTTVEVPSGGSFAIAGLMQQTTKQVLDSFPGLKDMPVLGALFRSRDFQNNETELVVVVSAYMVQPTTEAALTLPTDGFVPATDLETIFLGRLNSVYKRDEANAVKATAQAPVGFIVQ